MGKALDRHRAKTVAARTGRPVKATTAQRRQATKAAGTDLAVRVVLARKI